jgi:hypothetical protein
MDLVWLFILGLLFSERKKIPRNAEETEILIHSVRFFLFRGAERKMHGIPFRTILRKITIWNSVPNHFAKQKNTRYFIISFQTIPRKIKILGISQIRSKVRISFRTIRQRKKFRNLRWCSHDAFFIYECKEFFLFLCCLFPQTSFFRGIRPVPLPTLGMGYFAEFFSLDGIFDGNPCSYCM